MPGGDKDLILRAIQSRERVLDPCKLLLHICVLFANFGHDLDRLCELIHASLEVAPPDRHPVFVH
eukprot:8193274-Pyramimonas_sp.AAC.1